jgi:selenocysteine lyase/cysteine desulfurase
MDMHPDRAGAHLDAIFFSPHKFLGGPGTPGVLIFNKAFYRPGVPDHPGGGCVNWTDPRGKIIYVDSIEDREDAGTPGFLQTIKAALCIRLKEEMGTENIAVRERQVLQLIWDKLAAIPDVQILAADRPERLGIISFGITGLHYHLAARMLNDFFGIQCRGGCSCAGTYGHHLLQIDREQSESIADAITQGDFSSKPGWVRISVHPTMTDTEARFVGDSVEELVRNHHHWREHYNFDCATNSMSAINAPLDWALKQHLNAALWQLPLKNDVNSTLKGSTSEIML